MSVVLLAYLAFFSIALPDATLGVAWPSMRVDFGQPTSAAGLVPPVGVAATLVSTTAAARLATRLGVGRLLTGSTLLSAAALGIAAASGSFGQFLVSVALGGLSAGAIDATLNAVAARSFGPRRINLLHASYGVGAAVSPLVVVAAVASGAGWRFAFALVALAQLLLAIAFGLTRWRWSVASAESSTDGRPAPAPTSEQAPAEPRLRLNAILGLVAVLLQTGIESSVALWAYIFLTEGAGVGPVVAGALTSGYWLMLVVGRVLLGMMAERVGTWPVLSGAVAGMTGAGVLAAVGSPPAAVASVLLFGLAGAPVYPLLVLTTAERTSARMADRVIGYQAAASSVGAAALPLVVGLAMADSAARFGMAVGLLSAAALAVHLAVRFRRPRTRNSS